jgi:hypothetical protein
MNEVLKFINKQEVVKLLSRQAVWCISAKASENVVRNGTIPSTECVATQPQLSIQQR